MGAIEFSEDENKYRGLNTVRLKKDTTNNLIKMKACDVNLNPKNLWYRLNCFNCPVGETETPIGWHGNPISIEGFTPVQDDIFPFAASGSYTNSGGFEISYDGIYEGINPKETLPPLFEPDNNPIECSDIWWYERTDLKEQVKINSVNRYERDILFSPRSVKNIKRDGSSYPPFPGQTYPIAGELTVPPIALNSDAFDAHDYNFYTAYPVGVDDFDDVAPWQVGAAGGFRIIWKFLIAPLGDTFPDNTKSRILVVAQFGHARHVPSGFPVWHLPDDGTGSAFTKVSWYRFLGIRSVDGTPDGSYATPFVQDTIPGETDGFPIASPPIRIQTWSSGELTCEDIENFRDITLNTDSALSTGPPVGNNTIRINFSKIPSYDHKDYRDV